MSSDSVISMSSRDVPKWLSQTTHSSIRSIEGLDTEILITRSGLKEPKLWVMTPWFVPYAETTRLR